MKRILPLIGTLLTALNCPSQVITGIVSDCDGILLGATIFTKGSHNITTTDFNGFYKINAKESDTLIFQYFGYQTTMKSIESRSIINVRLEPNFNQLRYDSCWTKRLIITPITFVTPPQFEQIKRLIQLRENIEKPNNYNIPLKNVISIDGIIISDNELKAIDPNTIKSATIVKDDESTEPHHRRTPHLIITTKSGAFYHIWNQERQLRLLK